MDRQIIVSACLLGRHCRYDGRSKANARVEAHVRALREAGVEVVAVCPEELGGLPTPRPPADLHGGDGHAVLDGRASVRRTRDGADVTDAFVRGARAARALAPRADEAILKARSPSCGVGRTHIDGALAPGDGVFAALLTREGVACRTEDDVG